MSKNLVEKLIKTAWLAGMTPIETVTMLMEYVVIVDVQAGLKAINKLFFQLSVFASNNTTLTQFLDKRKA